MAEKGLRRDAELNREKLVAAGRVLFAERGADATLNEVAHHAGVGVGTAYRRFPHKQALFDAIFEQQITELEQVLHEALAKSDAWAGIVLYLEQSSAMQARDRGMAQILSGRRVRPEQYDWERDKLAPLVDDLVNRAREQGSLRADVTGADLVFLQIGLSGIAETTRGARDKPVREDVADLHRRYLWLMLDGLRAHPHQASLLPVPPLTTEQTHQLLAWTPTP